MEDQVKKFIAEHKEQKNTKQDGTAAAPEYKQTRRDKRAEKEFEKFKSKINEAG